MYGSTHFFTYLNIFFSNLLLIQAGQLSVSVKGSCAINCCQGPKSAQEKVDTDRFFEHAYHDLTSVE